MQRNYWIYKLNNWTIQTKFKKNDFSPSDLFSVRFEEMNLCCFQGNVCFFSNAKNLPILLAGRRHFKCLHCHCLLFLWQRHALCQNISCCTLLKSSYHNCVLQMRSLHILPQLSLSVEASVLAPSWLMCWNSLVLLFDYGTLPVCVSAAKFDVAKHSAIN